MNIPTFNTPVADNIARILNEKRLVQCKIAKDAGFTTQAFNDLIHGRRVIKACDIPAISKALGVEPNELFKRGGGRNDLPKTNNEYN